MAPPKVDNEYRNQIKTAREQLEKRISDNKHYAPLMLHLALHDAGIYGFNVGTEYYLIKGGPNGSIRNEELNHPSNKDLKKAVEICEEVKSKNDKITYADLYQLAGVAAVQITGGPKIEFVPGREDSTEHPEKGLLSDNKLDESQLEKIRKRMGLEKRDMVTLFGGLHQWKLPVETPDVQQPELKFDNSYFRDLKKSEPNNLLLKCEGLREWAEVYATDEKAFLQDYAAAHKKVSERGMSLATLGQGGGTQTGQTTPTGHERTHSAPRNRVRLLQGIGIAVVTTAIIIGFFLSRRSK